MPEAAAARARAWVESVVVDLQLCPFAAPVLDAGRLRIAVSGAREPAGLLADLEAELRRLVAHPPEEIETTLLVHPRLLRDFLAFNDFLGEVDALVARLDLEGVVQVASFHPGYVFGDAAGDEPARDPANYSNRSPDPMLHLLREESVSRAVDGHPDVASVPRANVARLRALGRGPLAQRLAACRAVEPRR